MVDGSGRRSLSCSFRRELRPTPCGPRFPRSSSLIHAESRMEHPAFAKHLQEMVAGVRFELTTFGLCDLTQLSLRVGLYLHPLGMLAIQSLRLPRVSEAWFGIAVSQTTGLRFHRL